MSVWWRPGADRQIMMAGVMMSSWLGLLLLAGAVYASHNIQVSGCNGQTIRAKCPDGHQIAIKRIFFGVKTNSECVNSPPYRGVSGRGGRYNVSTTSDCCKHTSADCMMDEDSKYSNYNIKCSGHQKCDISVEKTRTKDPCRFKSYTDVLTIVYSCIAVEDIAILCSNDSKRGKALYLTNREYPDQIKTPAERMNCQCMVKTSNPEGISVHTIDVLLASPSGMECTRTLSIQDPMSYQKTLQCSAIGLYGFKSVYSRSAENVTLTLNVLPVDGLGYIFLQVKPNDADGMVEVLCGQVLENLLTQIKDEAEARELAIQTENNPVGEGAVRNETVTSPNSTNVLVAASSHALNSDLAAIIGGIVAAGFLLIAIVIVAMALHCRKINKDNQARKPLELYPAVNSEPLDLASYCRYDFDDDHLPTINRSPMKMAALTDEGPVASQRRPNGFTTLSRAEEYRVHRDPTPSPPLPLGISTPPPSVQNQPLLSQRSYREVYYPGDLSLRFVKPLHTCTDLDPYYLKQGHTTLPSNRKAVLISSGPKSPLGKRSKSVTFSQPVAMVTPLNAESEESMENKNNVIDDVDEPNYDNLNKLTIPDQPVLPGQPELVKIPRWEKDYMDDTPARPMFTFQNSLDATDDLLGYPAPPPEFKASCDSDDLAYMSDSSASFWYPSKPIGKSLMLPKPQNAQLFETGV